MDKSTINWIEKTTVVQVAMCSLLTILSIVILHFVFPGIDTTENSILEDAQAVAITLAMVVYGYYTVKQQHKIATLGFVLLLFSFLIRELDVEEFTRLPDVMRYYLGKEGKPITMVVTWGGYLVLAGIFLKDKLFKLKSFLHTYEGKLWICAFVVLVFAQLMDKNILHMINHENRYFEEFWELSSYLFMFAASLFHQDNRH